MKKYASNLEDNQNDLNLIRCNLSCLLLMAEQENGYHVFTETTYNALNAVERALAGAVDEYEKQVNEIYSDIRAEATT